MSRSASRLGDWVYPARGTVFHTPCLNVFKSKYHCFCVLFSRVALSSNMRHIGFCDQFASKFCSASLSMYRYIATLQPNCRIAGKLRSKSGFATHLSRLTSARQLIEPSIDIFINRNRHLALILLLGRKREKLCAVTKIARIIHTALQ